MDIGNFYEIKHYFATTLLFNHAIVQNSSLLELMKLSYIFDSTSHGDSSTNRFFSYAWEVMENDDTSVKDDERESKIASIAIKEASRIMSETDVLVIIGYSFPAFNKEVDKELLGQLVNNGKFKMVYYQVPNANIELLKNRFNIPSEKITPVKDDVRQFEFPLHYL